MIRTSVTGLYGKLQTLAEQVAGSLTAEETLEAIKQRDALNDSDEEGTVQVCYMVLCFSHAAHLPLIMENFCLAVPDPCPAQTREEPALHRSSTCQFQAKDCNGGPFTSEPQLLTESEQRSLC